MTLRAPRTWLVIATLAAAAAACEAQPSGTGHAPDAAATPLPDARADDAVFLTVTMGDASVAFGDPTAGGEQVDGGVRYTVSGPASAGAGLYLLELHLPEPGGLVVDCQARRDTAHPELADFEFTHVAGHLNYAVDRTATPCGFTLTEAPAAPARRGYLAGSFTATVRERAGQRVQLRGSFRVPTPFWWGRH
jgi:hypothetical protein